MADISIGTCGYQRYAPGEGWKDEYESKLHAYSDAFAVGELNRTFYELPQVATTERWRREVTTGFEFTVKAWQALTHAWNSPTWNGHRDSVPEEQTDAVGNLQPTEFVRQAWDAVMDRATALEASVILIQTPPSFGYSESHEENMQQLLGSVDRDGVAIAWEPRGDWPEHRDRIKQLCSDLDLIHVTDLMRSDPVAESSILYTRLHGLNTDPYDYDYDYSDSELQTLARRLEEASATYDRVYCLFNNFEMYTNAQRLREFL